VGRARLGCLRRGLGWIVGNQLRGECKGGLVGGEYELQLT